MSGGEEELRDFHQAVDRAAQAVARRHGERLQCRRGCHDCCADGLTVLEVEAERIRRETGDFLQREAPHPDGACAMLDQDGACRIYDQRPYVCRTQGLPLQVFEETAAGELRERRDICPLNAEGPPLAGLPPEELWLVGPRELELVRLQERWQGPPRRVPLRSLFRRTAPPPDRGHSRGPGG